MNEPFVAFTAETGLLQGSRVLTTTYAGVLRVTDEELVLEFTTRRGMVGGGAGVFVIGSSGALTSLLPDDSADTAVTTARIPLGHVGSLERSGGWFRKPRLRVEANRLSALAAVPWAEGAEFTVVLSRRDARRARELALELRLRMADAQLRRLDEGAP